MSREPGPSSPPELAQVPEILQRTTHEARLRGASYRRFGPGTIARVRNRPLPGSEAIPYNKVRQK
jgi:hypothetical protein